MIRSVFVAMLAFGLLPTTAPVGVPAPDAQLCFENLTSALPFADQPCYQECTQVSPQPEITNQEEPPEESRVTTFCSTI